MKFYRCTHCGNIVTFLHDSNVLTSCCGQKMGLLIPNSTDASPEKHIPVVSVCNGEFIVKVGCVEHPMVPEHHIQWIALETKLGFQVKYLSPGQKPAASFALASGDALIAAYEYCNLHGLWKC